MNRVSGGPEDSRPSALSGAESLGAGQNQMRQRKRWAPAPKGLNNDHAELKHSKSVLEAWETPNRKEKTRSLFEPPQRQEDPDEDDDVFEKAMKEQNQ